MGNASGVGNCEEVGQAMLGVITLLKTGCSGEE